MLFFMVFLVGMKFALIKSVRFKRQKWVLEQKIMAYYVNFALKVLNFIAFFKKKHYFFEKMKSWHGTCLLNKGEVKT